MAKTWAQWSDRLIFSPLARTAGWGLHETLNLLIPTNCALCERADLRLCPPCRSKLCRAMDNLPTPPQLRMILELPGGHPQFMTCAAGLYANELARGILAFKNHQRLFLAEVFAPYLAVLANTVCPPLPAGQRVWLVPMPSSPKARTTRGYWPVHQLVQRAQRRGLLDSALCQRTVLKYRLANSFSATQKSRSGRQRREANSALYAFAAPRAGQQIILVDDVLTTGATMIAAAQACTAAGYQVIGGVVVALTAPPEGYLRNELC